MKIRLFIVLLFSILGNFIYGAGTVTISSITNVTCPNMSPGNGIINVSTDPAMGNYKYILERFVAGVFIKVDSSNWIAANTFTFTNVSAANNYAVFVYYKDNPDTVALTATMFNVLAPTIGTISASQNICYNKDPALITSTLATTHTGSITYKWYYSDDNSVWNDASTSTPTYDPATLLTAVRYYKRNVSFSVCGATEYSSNTHTVSVYNDVLAGSISYGGASICNGGTASISAGANASGGIGPLNYSWESAPAAVGPWTAIAGTGTSLTTPALTSPTYFHRIATDGGGCGTATTTAVLVNVYAVVVKPTISYVTPGSATVCFKNTNTPKDVPVPSLINKATASGGSNSFTYKWQVWNAATSVWKDTVTAAYVTYAALANLTPNINSAYSRRYRLLAKDATCDTVSSNVLDIKVSNFTLSLSVLKGLTCANGTDAQLQINVTGVTNGAVSYGWRLGNRLGVLQSSANPWTAVGQGGYYAYVEDQACTYASSSEGSMLLSFVKANVLFRDSIPYPLSVVADSIVKTCPSANTGKIVLHSSGRGWGAPISYKISGFGYQTADSTFNNLANGTYQIYVKDRKGCEMLGTDAVVGTWPNPTIYDITPSGGPFCSAAGATIGLSGSESLFSYKLYRDGSLISTLAGTGAALSFGSQTTVGTYTIVANNSRGCTWNMNGNVVINLTPTASISAGGVTTFCVGGSVTLNAVTSLGYTYQWKLNGSDIAGATLSSYGATISGDYTVQVTNGGCSAISNIITVTVNPLPVDPGVITGTTPVCQGQSGVAYSIAAVSNATSYTWTLPTGASIASGAGTNSITVNFNNTASSGNITVVGVNACGTSPTPGTYAVTVNPLPGNPGAITGTTPVCQGQSGVAYSIAAVSNATSYTWTLPTGASIASGAGTNSITVNFNNTASSGNITVVGVNACGTSPTPGTYAVTVNPLPGNPGAITGTTPVCQGQSGVAYSIAAVSNATSYTWTLPTGASIASGAGTNSITVNFSNTASSGNITVVGVNACGTSPTPASYAVTVNLLPGNPGAITGTTPVCQGQSGVAYSIAAVSNATSYTWTLPTGASIASGAGTNSITVNFNNTASSGNITVVGVNACGTSPTPASYAVTVNPLPGNPGAITGITPVCQGQSGVAYSIAAVSNATSYTWTLPTGASIASGAGTNSITVNFNNTASSGNITVVGVNACGTSPTPGTYAVTVNPLPGNPGAITGTTPVCQGQSGVAYSIAAVSNATSYTWTLPTGASIASGAGTNSITVNFSNTASSGNITVVGVNACGTSPTPASYAVTVNLLPGNPGAITGTTPVCQGQSGVAYSIAAVSNATSYTWTLPTGASIASGAGTNSITVNFNNTASSGNITVVGVNACGTSPTPASYAVTVNPLPGNPGAITGITPVCQGQSGVAYSIAAVSNATSYTWTLPTGASIASGAGTNSITVNFNNTASSGNITVVGVNACGTSPTPGTYAVTVNPLPGNPGAITGTTPVCQGQSGVAYSIAAVSNATSYTWTLPTGASIASGTGTNSITVNFSNTASSGNITVVGVNTCGTSLVSSSYAVTVNPLPSNPGAITGTTAVCQGQTGVAYSIAAVPNATSYTWTLPTGASIASGAGTSSITVNFNNTASSGNITVVGVNACGTSPTPASYAVTVNPLPGNPGAITGTTPVCQGQSGVAYSIAAVSNATSYTWTLPTGASIASGAGTNSITVNFSNTASSGNITVVGVNTCGTSPTPGSFAIIVNPLPGNPGAITGTTPVCQGQSGVAYSIAAVPNATSYTWTLPTGASIASGAGTNSITVNFNNTASSGNITVVGVNTCGTSLVPSSYAVTVNPLPGNPGAITGTTPVCQGQSGVAYSIAAVTNATSYTWTLPTGASIASGAGTNSITVNFSNTASSGNITVVGVNTCGTSLVSSSYAVTVNPLPGNPGAITGTTPVCQGQSGVAYSIAAVSNATSYTWTLPTGASIASGAGTNSITVNFSNTASSGNITVVGVNACGTSPTPASYAVTVNPLPGNPGAITGTTPVCQGQSGVAYSIAAVPNATSYTWTLPTGASIASGTGTNSITVNFSNTASSGNITVVGVNTCGTSLVSSSYAVTVNPLPGNPGAITGTTPVCQGQSGVAYSIAAVSNATSYTWTLPTGASIASGAGTNSITVNFSNTASSGNITVVGVNACGTSPTPASYAVTVNPLPGNPGAITGTTPVCQGQSGVAYSIAAVSNATSYTWTLPTGASIASGGGTNSIIVDFSNTASSGNITVVGVNACGTSPTPASYAVTVNPLPGNPGAITGTTPVCQGQSGVAYSIAAVPNATSYTWTLPTGASIASGTGTNSITVNFSNTASSGNITVVGVNTCGTSLVSSSYAVTVNPLPGNPGAITGTTPVCQGQSGVAYSIAAVSNATSYTWTLPTGASIASGAGTNSITVNFSNTASSGNITVVGVNTCGTSPTPGSFAIIVNPLPGNPGAITGTTPVCQGQSGVAYSIAGVPNATSYTWTLPTGASIASGAGTNSITVNFNNTASSGNITVVGVNTCGTSLVPSSYAVTVNPLPGNPGAITGTTPVCQGQSGVAYSIAAVPNATSYTWTLPTGASIASGAGTNSITVNFSNTASSGNITVVGVNTCGTSLVSSSYAVTVNPLPGNPGAITGTTPVCQGQSGVAYSIAAVSNATSYTWTLPTGASIASGAGTNSITVNFSNTASSGNITVVGVNTCGTSPTPGSFAIIVNPLPGNPGAITGTTPVCQGQSGVAYSIAAVSNATSYTWTLPTGASIASGAGTNSITINFSNTASSGNITVVGVNICGTSLVPSSYAVTVNPLPDNPGLVMGTTPVCQGQNGVAYSIAAVSNATSYTWTLPTGASIASGAGTNSITVNFSNTAASGNVIVVGTNACGNSVASSSLFVTVNPLPGNPGAITGITPVCQGQNGVAYSIAAVSNATSYTWTLPTGASIASGAGTNSITVNFNNTASSGNITVVGVNACGTSPTPGSYAVTVNPLPGNPGAIIGTTPVCQGESGVAYSIATVSNATSYTWTLPTGASIASGAGTNSITVDFSNTASSGNISVVGVNTCGTSLVSSSYAVIVNLLPGDPGVIVGSNTVCQGQTGENYSITAVSDATSYFWTVPVGATIVSGFGTSSIMVDFGGSAVSGNISVVGVNACGNSLVASSLNVIVNVAPLVFAGKNDTVCSNGDIVIMDAIASDYNDVQWTVLNPLDGSFLAGSELTLNPVYTPGSLERQNGSVTLVLTANSLTCGSVTDTVTYTILPELFAVVGSFSPYLVGPGTRISVGIKIQNRLSVSDLGLYLVAPNGNSVRLTDHSIGAMTWFSDYCNYNTNVDAVFKTNLPSSDSVDVCSLGDITGTFAAAGSWASIYGSDPANGVWKLIVVDNDNMHGGGIDGNLISYYVRFYDKNISGDSVALLYNSGTINAQILEAQSATTPLSNSYTSSLELTTKCFDCTTGSGLGAMAVVSKTGGSGVYYRASWYNVLDPNTIIAIGDTTELCKGSYFAVVNDKYGCIDTAFVEVKSPLPIKIDSIRYSPNDTLVCVGATTDVTVYAHGGTGTLKFTIDGKTQNTGVTASGIKAGTYTVHVFDDNGCPKDTFVTIVQMAAIAITDSSKIDVHCFGDSIGEVHVTATGGKLLKYQLWNAVTKNIVRENGLSPDFIGLKAGQYRVIVSDSLYGCTGDTSGIMAVLQPKRLIIDSLEVHNYSCTGVVDGSIRFYAVSGGTRQYNYSLNGSAFGTDSTFSPLAAGNYHAIVKDFYGCKDSVDAVIIDPAPIAIDSIVFSVNDTLQCNGQKTDVTIYANNGGGSLKYTFVGSSDTIPINTPFKLGAGVFKFSIFEYAGACKLDTTLTITEPSAIAITLDSVKNIQCHGGQFGEIHVSATGGNLIKYQLWDVTSKTVIRENGKKTDFYNLAVGQYRVIASDSIFGCGGDSTAIIPITEPLAISFNLVTDSVKCYGESNGLISIVGLTGGTVSKPDRYLMNIDGVDVGYQLYFGSQAANVNYSITVTDSLGCSLTKSAMVYQAPKITIDRSLWSSNNATTCINPDGSIAVVMPAGNPATLQYSLDLTSWNSTGVFTDIPARYPYRVFIRDQTHKQCVMSDTITVSGPYVTAPLVQAISPVCHGGTGSLLITNTANEMVYYSVNNFSYKDSLYPNPDYDSLVNLTVKRRYNVFVRNAAYCEAWATDSLEDTKALVINYRYLKDTIILDSISHGKPPYIITWQTPSYTISTISIGDTLTDLEYGIHTISVIDSNKCTASVDIYTCTGIDATTSKKGVKCFRDTTGSISVTIDNSSVLSPLYSYNLNGDGVETVNTSYTFHGLRTGGYRLIVLDHSNKVNCYSEYIDVPTLSYLHINDKDSLRPTYNPFLLYTQCNAYPYDLAHTWVTPLVIKGYNKPVNLVWNYKDTIDSIYAPVGNHVFIASDSIGCRDSATYTVQAIHEVIPDAGPNMYLCPLKSDTLYGSSLQVGYVNPKYSYQWFADTTRIKLGSRNLSKCSVTSVSGSGIEIQAILMVTIDEVGYSGTCWDFDTTTIEVYPRYGLTIGAYLTTGFEVRDTMTYGRNISFKVEAVPDSFENYIWTPGNYVEGPDSLFQATFRMPEMGYVTVTAITMEGCVETSNLFVNVPGALKPPAGFTPNGDGINDIWYIKDAEAYPDLKVEIFGRWGSKVYQSSGYDNVIKKFDGTRNGRPLPVGTYYYILNVGDGSSPITGSVTIVR